MRSVSIDRFRNRSLDEGDLLYFTTLFTLCSPHPPHPPPHPNTAPIFERQNTGLVMIFCKFFFSNHQRSIKALIFSILGHNLLADSTTYCLSEDTVKISWSNVIACSSQIRVVVPSPASFRPERERERERERVCRRSRRKAAPS